VNRLLGFVPLGAVVFAVSGCYGTSWTFNPAAETQPDYPGRAVAEPWLGGEAPDACHYIGQMYGNDLVAGYGSSLAPAERAADEIAQEAAARGADMFVFLGAHHRDNTVAINHYNYLQVRAISYYGLFRCEEAS
jgi:hypothetical protein